MVVEWLSALCWFPLRFGVLLAQEADAAEPLLWRLDPERRAGVALALLALLLLGLLMLSVVVLGGRRLRRIARMRSRPSRTFEDQWYRKPLVPREPAPPPVHDPE